MQIEYFKWKLNFDIVRGLKLVFAKGPTTINEPENEKNKFNSPYNSEFLLIVGILYGRVFLYFRKIFEKLARGYSVAATALGSCYEQR